MPVSKGPVLPRIYEYVDQEGNVYWSFTKRSSVISTGIRLVLSDRKGTYLMQFKSALPKLWAELGNQTEPLEGE